MASPPSRPVPPAVILVEPQLGENIGMAARAMANFGFVDLRLVAPRDGWPNPASRAAAAGADGILDAARVFTTTRDAVADLGTVFATSARSRGQMKRVLSPAEAVAAEAERGADGPRAGILFGPERTGLGNEDIALADALVTFPVDPAFASLNLAQAVLLVGYEWARTVAAAPGPARRRPEPLPAPRGEVMGLTDHLVAELDAAGFFPPDKKPIMSRNLVDMIVRMKPTEQDVRTLRGAIACLAHGRKRRLRPLPVDPPAAERS